MASRFLEAPLTMRRFLLALLFLAAACRGASTGPLVATTTLLMSLPTAIGGGATGDDTATTEANGATWVPAATASAPPAAATPLIASAVAVVNTTVPFNESARVAELPDGELARNLTLDELDRLHDDGGKVFVVFASLMMLAFSIGHLLHKSGISWIPESLVVVVLGVVVGVILPTGNSSLLTFHITTITIEEESLINEMILNFILLPIIIYEAGWGMNHKDFISQLPYILIFAIFGTLISMAVVGGLILWLSDYTQISHPRTAFCYAALISAVDPVATLATYAHLRVDPLLNTLVFGESVINDAVAIVLFKVLNEWTVAEFNEQKSSDLLGALFSGVASLLFFSVGLGLLLGVLLVLILRMTKMGETVPMAVLFIFFSAFFTYNFAESICGCSGIIAVLFCGMVMGGYATPHLSAEGTMLTSFLLKQFATIADMVVFMFVGVSVVYAKRDTGLVLGLYVSLFCLVGRLAATVPLGCLSNAIKNTALKSRPVERRHLLTWKHILMMWHAGLRGGIALVLTLELGDWVDELEGEGTKSHLRNCTAFIIVLFLLVFGGSTAKSLEALGIPMGGTGKIHHHDGSVKSFYKRVRKLGLKLLVGKTKKKQETGDGIIGTVLDEARNQENGSTVQARVSRARTLGGLRFALFGTSDPTHSSEVGHHRRRAMRRRTAEEVGEDGEGSSGSGDSDGSTRSSSSDEDIDNDHSSQSDEEALRTDSKHDIQRPSN